MKSHKEQAVIKVYLYGSEHTYWSIPIHKSTTAKDVCALVQLKLDIVDNLLCLYSCTEHKGKHNLQTQRISCTNFYVTEKGMSDVTILWKMKRKWLKNKAHKFKVKSSQALTSLASISILTAPQTASSEQSVPTLKPPPLVSLDGAKEPVHTHDSRDLFVVTTETTVLPPSPATPTMELFSPFDAPLPPFTDFPVLAVQTPQTPHATPFTPTYPEPHPVTPFSTSPVDYFQTGGPSPRLTHPSASQTMPPHYPTVFDPTAPIPHTDPNVTSTVSTHPTGMNALFNTVPTTNIQPAEGIMMQKWHTFFVSTGIPEDKAKEYAEVFSSEDIDFSHLALLDDAKLKELGVSKMGHRISILKATMPKIGMPPSSPGASPRWTHDVWPEQDLAQPVWPKDI